MVGLQFRVKNEYDSYLRKILQHVNVQNYKWVVITDDVINSLTKSDVAGLFDSNIISGQELFNRIQQENYYLIFIDLKAFPINSVQSEIKTYQDFIQSSCQIILLCVDSEFFEFYSKERSILDVVYNNCINFDFKDIRYISEEEAIHRSMIAF